MKDEEAKKQANLSRRRFLKGSVIGAGALTAGLGTGLILNPGTAHAELGYLPYCTLNVEEVRYRAWRHYKLSGG